MSGLAGADLAADFNEILARGSDGTHQLVTVFEALTKGAPLEVLRSTLWKIAIDPQQPGWQRERACDAWLNGAQDRVRELYDAISATPASAAREKLRVHVASRMPADALSTPELKALIADYAKSAEAHDVSSLFLLALTLERQSWAELFDVHVKTWLWGKSWSTTTLVLKPFSIGCSLRRFAAPLGCQHSICGRG